MGVAAGANGESGFAIVSTQQKWCECCRERRVAVRRVASPAGVNLTGRTRVELCRQCADAKHELGQCLACVAVLGVTHRDTWVWGCAQRDHLANVHPRIIEKRVRAPEDEPEPALPENLTYVGRVDPDAVERVHREEDL